MSYTGSLCLVLALLSVFVVYYLHKPLPHQFTERSKMQVLEFLMRLVYYYPMKHLSIFGVEWQLYWTRNSLDSAAKVIGPWSTNDPLLTIENTVFDGVPVRVYIPKSARKSDGAVVFIHGGGFVIGTIDGYEGLVRNLARKLGMVTVSVDYRLAPEHIFPAPVIDCERVLINFLSVSHQHYGVDPNNVVIMGDSAGGNLAAVTTQRLRHKTDLPPIKLQVLIYPLLQYSDLLTPSYQQYYHAYPDTAFLDPESIARWLLLYLGIEAHPDRVRNVLMNNHTSWEAKQSTHYQYIKHDLLPSDFMQEEVYVRPPTLDGDQELHKLLEPYIFNPDFAPLMQHDLSNLPKAYIMTCGYDILRDEGFFYANRLRSNGINVTYQHYEEAFHAMLNFPHLELVQEAVGNIVTFVHENTLS